MILLSNRAIYESKSVRLMQPTHKHNAVIVRTPADLKKKKKKKKNHISVSRFLKVIGPSGIQLGLESFERLTSKSDGRKREAHLLITRTTLDNIFTMEKLLPTCQNKDNFQEIIHIN